jgi:hypothetical protein
MMFESKMIGGLGASRMDQQSKEGDATPMAKESTLAGTSFIPTDVEEDTNMLVDVQQMVVVVVVASHEKTSFEVQLQPMEQYVMQFLELWDPQVNNLAIEAPVLSFFASIFFLDI